MVNASPQRSSPALNFVYYVLKPRTHRLPFTVDSHFTGLVISTASLPFLDCLDTRDNNRLQTTTQNQNISTDYWTSHLNRPLKRTKTRLSQIFCVSPDSKQDETNYLNNVFSNNNYQEDFVKRSTHSNADPNTQIDVNSASVATAIAP